MAQNTLPPPPINDKPGSFAWLEWYRQLRNYVSTSGSVPWYIINFAGSNITDLAVREHNTLQNTQGGSAGQKYHVTEEIHNRLVNQTPLRSIVLNTPVTGDTYNTTSTTSILRLEHDATIAALTINLPQNIPSGFTFTITAKSEVTALTLVDSSKTINNTITTIAAGGYVSFVADATAWYRIG